MKEQDTNKQIQLSDIEKNLKDILAEGLSANKQINATSPEVDTTTTNFKDKIFNQSSSSNIQMIKKLSSGSTELHSDDKTSTKFIKRTRVIPP